MTTKLTAYTFGKKKEMEFKELKEAVTIALDMLNSVGVMPAQIKEYDKVVWIMTDDRDGSIEKLEGLR